MFVNIVFNTKHLTKLISRLFPGYLIIMLCLTLSCVRVASYQTGQEAFDKEQYRLAIKLLEKEQQKTEDAQVKYEQNILIAESYKKLHDYDKAEKYALRARDLREKGDAEELLAEIYKSQEKFSEVLKMYKEAGILQGDPFKFRRKIKELEYLKSLSEQPIGLKLLKTEFSTGRSEYSISSYDSGYLISTDAYENGNGIYTQTGGYFHDIALWKKWFSELARRWYKYRS